MKEVHLIELENAPEYGLVNSVDGSKEFVFFDKDKEICKELVTIINSHDELISITKKRGGILFLLETMNKITKSEAVELKRISNLLKSLEK